MLKLARSVIYVALSIALFLSLLAIFGLSFAKVFGKTLFSEDYIEQPALPAAKFDEDQLTPLLQVVNNRSEAWQESTDYWERQTSGPKNRCVDDIPCRPREVKRSLKIRISWTEKGGELGLTGDTFTNPSEAVEFLQFWNVEAYLDKHFGE